MREIRRLMRERGELKRLTRQGGERERERERERTRERERERERERKKRQGVLMLTAEPIRVIHTNVSIEP